MSSVDRPRVVLLPILMLSLTAVARPSDLVTYEEVKEPSRVEVWFTNVSRVPVTIKLDIEQTNGRVLGVTDFVVLAAGEKGLAACLEASGSGAWRYWWKHFVYYGDVRLKRSAKNFAVPWSHGLAFSVSQGFTGALSHQGPTEFALDFPMPIGTPIRAAREGLVVNCQDSFRLHGTKPEFVGKDNLVMLAHADGTLTRYVHLRYHGIAVKVGDWVSAGEVIGYSGDVGYSDGPHLHFDVGRPDFSTGYQSIPFSLLVGNRSTVPLEGEQIFP